MCVRSSDRITNVSTEAVIRMDCVVTMFRCSLQIVGIIDVFDALTSARPYRPALRHRDRRPAPVHGGEKAASYPASLSARFSRHWTKSRRRYYGRESQPRGLKTTAETQARQPGSKDRPAVIIRDAAAWSAAARVHLEVGIAAQRVERDQRCAIAALQVVLRRRGRDALPEWRESIAASSGGVAPPRSAARRSSTPRGIQAEVPHAVGGQPAAIAVLAERLASSTR